MMMKHLVAACAGAAALIGVASAPASAATAINDEGFRTTPGGRLVINISRLLRNDLRARGERIRFTGFNEHFGGIEDVTRRGNRLIVDIEEDYFERNTSFVYFIEGIRRVRGRRIVSTSEAFVRIRVISDT